MYDYLVVRAGLCGAVLVQRIKESGHSVIVVEKRPHIGENVYTEKRNGIHIHKYAVYRKGGQR